MFIGYIIIICNSNAKIKGQNQVVYVDSVASKFSPITLNIKIECSAGDS